MNTTRLGLKNNKIELLPYDPKWPILFENEKLRIGKALRHHALDVQHIGSTSVPGLSAKPIIDILIALKDFGEIDKINNIMNSIGYEYFDEFKIPGDYIFTLGNPTQINVHIVEITSTNWIRILLFRDRLRSDPELARSYFELKKRLAQNYNEGKGPYAHGKTDFVMNALKNK